MKAILIPAALAVTALGHADDFSLLGRWSGRIEITAPPLPAGTSSAMRARIHAMAAEGRRGRLVLKMFRDHRYTLQNVNMPSFGPANMRGIWFRHGGILTLTPTGTSRENRFVVDPTNRRFTGEAHFGSNTVRYVFVR